MKCNLTEEEQKQAIERPFLCTAEEADFIEHCFTGYLFFEHEADEENRLGVRTTCSYCNAQTWHTEREWKCFKGKTKCGDTLRCPACGNTVTLYPRGRLRSGKTMDEDRQIVLLRAEGDSLRAVALCAWKHHGRRESDAAEFVVKASYYFAQGKCQKWRRKWVWDSMMMAAILVPQKTMTEPFEKKMYSGYGAEYFLFGIDEIAKSPLRYCGAERYFGLDTDTFREVEGVMTYLGLWTRYPRIEQLTRTGCSEIVRDALNGNMHTRALNWRAKTVQGFFGVDKQSAKRLLADGIGQSTLEALELVRRGVPMDEALTVCREISGNDERRKCQEKMDALGERMIVLARYLEKNPYRRAGLWLDYIDAAQRLGYDLTQQNVRFPKELRAAHDDAIAAVRYEENAQARAAYAKRYEKLRRKYAFSTLGLSIVVPQDDREIIDEGKTLRHCVGGYAERHMKGDVTILFLRKERTPERSYITIEMCGKKGDDIRQIHGYRNENKGGHRLATPYERHGEFLKLWLEWLKDGSKRDKSGRPILPKKGDRTA